VVRDMRRPAGATADVRRPRMRLAEDRFRTLMEAAAAEFLARGYRPASIETIARASGIGKATIYRHFSDKAGLFQAVILREIELLSTPPMDLTADARDPEFVLFDVGLKALQLFLRPRSIAVHRRIIEAAPSFPELARLVRDRLTEWNLVPLARYFGKLAASRGWAVEDAEWAGRQFLNLATHGNLFLIASPPPDAAAQRQNVAEAVRLFLGGMMVPVR
jgi:TetR/AcrR family transcriptional repressor of mexJK operon